MEDKEEEATLVLSVSVSDAIFELREELMVSGITTNETPTLRPAHFLKPCFVDTDHVHDKTLALPHKKALVRPRLKVVFRGWRYPKRDWKAWVESLRLKHQSAWKKAGIYEAIMGSICEVKRDQDSQDFVLKLAEKWNPETNTFVFPWGEATVTLEDMAVLGGFSASGEPVLAQSLDGDEAGTERELVEATLAAVRPNARPNGCCLTRHFMGSERRLEHEAFLSLWLFRHVFPTKQYYLGLDVFPLAVRLARGARIALAPAVLASIYRDLSALKAALLAPEGNGRDSLTLTAPFQLVQVWGWERFSGRSPDPTPPSESISAAPRLARWAGLERACVADMRPNLEAATESFRWRPYSFYGAELESMALCLRPGELVGFDSAIEQYLPHRVARQFGMDQDVPCPVARHNSSPAVAWSNYSRPIWDKKMHIPTPDFKPGVTVAYAKWWKDTVLNPKDTFTSPVKGPRNTKRRPRMIGARNEGSSPASPAPKGQFLNSTIRAQEVVLEPLIDQTKKASETEIHEHRPMESENSTIRGHEVLMESVEKGKDTIRPLSVPLNSEKSAVGSAKKASESENVSTSAGEGGFVVVDQVKTAPKDVVIIDDDDEEEASNRFRGGERPRLDLEARLSRLERVIAELKRRRNASFSGDLMAKKSRV